MIVSLNEIETTLRKAALGVGLPLGIAEDVARAMAWAAPLPVAIAKLAAEALANVDQKHAGPNWRGEGKLSALWLGPALADVARIGVATSRSWENVDIPLLAAIVAASACDGDPSASATLAWSTAAVVIANGAVDIHASSVEELRARDRALHMDRRHAQANAAALFSPLDLRRCKVAALDRGIEVEHRSWTDLCRFAARMLVPATAQSRLKGAGAGDIDRG